MRKQGPRDKPANENQGMPRRKSPGSRPSKRDPSAKTDASRSSRKLPYVLVADDGIFSIVGLHADEEAPYLSTIVNSVNKVEPELARSKRLYDALILWFRSAEDSLYVCKRLRRSGHDIPILAVSWEEDAELFYTAEFYLGTFDHIDQFSFMRNLRRLDEILPRRGDHVTTKRRLMYRARVKAEDLRLSLERITPHLNYQNNNSEMRLQDFPLMRDEANEALRAVGAIRAALSEEFTYPGPINKSCEYLLDVGTKLGKWLEEKGGLVADDFARAINKPTGSVAISYVMQAREQIKSYLESTYIWMANSSGERP